MLRSRDGRISYLQNSALRDGRQKSNIDRVVHIDVIRKSTRQVKPRNVRGLDTEFPHRDVLAAVISRFRLGEIAHVLARKRDALLRNDGELTSFVSEYSLRRHHPMAAQLREQIDQSRAADTLRWRLADRAVVPPAAIVSQLFDRAVARRHAVFDEPALERRTRGARRRDQPAGMTHDHFRVGAHVDQHHDILLRMDVDR